MNPELFFHIRLYTFAALDWKNDLMWNSLDFYQRTGRCHPSFAVYQHYAVHRFSANLISKAFSTKGKPYQKTDLRIVLSMFSIFLGARTPDNTVNFTLQNSGGTCVSVPSLV